MWPRAFNPPQKLFAGTFVILKAHNARAQTIAACHRLYANDGKRFISVYGWIL